MKSSATFDFDDEKFQAPPSQVLPWCQMINPRLSRDGLKPHGLAIKLDQAKAAGFKPDENWQPMDHEFSTGNVETLFISTTPRLVVVRRGPVCIKDRLTGDNVGRLMDHYDTFKADRLKFKTFTRYLVFLVDQNKKFLHQSPLRLTLSGSTGASFGEAYRNAKAGQMATGFTAELEQAYADYSKKPFAPKGSLFHAHGIFCPILEAVEKGSGSNTAWVADIADYEHPKAHNLSEYLIASNSEESSIVCETFEEYKEFGQELPKPDMPKMEMAGVSSSSIYSDEYEYGDPPYMRNVWSEIEGVCEPLTEEWSHQKIDRRMKFLV